MKSTERICNLLLFGQHSASTFKQSLASLLIELKVVSGGAVAPGGLLGDLGTAQRTGVLAVQPRRDAELAEDVAAAEPHGRRVVVVADGARVAC